MRGGVDRPGRRLAFWLALATTAAIAVVLTAAEWTGEPPIRPTHSPLGLAIGRDSDMRARDEGGPGLTPVVTGERAEGMIDREARNAEPEPDFVIRLAERGAPSGADVLPADRTAVSPSSPAHAARTARRQARRLARQARIEAMAGGTAGGGAAGRPTGRTTAAVGSRQQVLAQNDRPQDAAQQPGDKSGQTSNGTAQANNHTGSQTAPDPNAAGDDVVIPVKAGDMDPADAHSRLRSNGDVFMFANSALTTTVDLPTAAQSVSIFAHGDIADGEWPRLVITVNGEPVGEVIVNSAVEKKFYVPIHADPGSAVIGVSYVNDFYDPATSQDRNAYVSKIKVHVAR
jgi:predicted xylan-binding protein with Ca-dependent carbohydrate-binding module